MRVCISVCVCVAFLHCANTYVVEEDGYLTFMKTFPNSGTLRGLVYLQYTKYNYGKKENSIWRKQTWFKMMTSCSACVFLGDSFHFALSYIFAACEI